MDEHDLDAIALPRLDAAQMAALGRCPLTTARRYRDGETLFEAGDRECKFDVVKSGAVEIRDETGETPNTIVALQPGQFTGDVTHLTGSPALVSGVAQGDCEVYEVSPDALRELMTRPPGPGRHHPAGVHRPVALPARVGAFHGPPRDRLARLARHLPGPHLPGQEWGAVHLAGTRDRPACEAIAPAVPGDRSRDARGRLGSQVRASESLEPRAGGGPRPPPATAAGGVRPGGGRGGAGGAGRGGLRRVRRAEHGRAGADGPGGPGRAEHAHRELPGLPHRDHRRRAGGARLRAGEQVRGAHAR